MTHWHAEVTLHADLTPEQQQHLTEALPGFAVIAYRADTRQAHITMIVQGDMLAQATLRVTDTIEQATRRITGNAEPVKIRVLTADEYEQEMEHPAPMDLVGATEGAQILKVSRQQFGDLADRHPDFPTPVATLARGKVWTRYSVEAFGQRWTRKKTGRPPKESAE